MSFLALSLSDSLWLLGAGDSEDASAPASLSVDACVGADDEADVVLRRRLPRIGIWRPDKEPARRVIIEIRRASRWKFRDEMRLRFVSDSGSGVALRSGVPTSGANTTHGVVEGAFCDADLSDVLPGKATRAASEVGRATGLTWGGVVSLTGTTYITFSLGSARGRSCA